MKPVLGFRLENFRLLGSLSLQVLPASLVERLLKRRVSDLGFRV